MNSPHKALRIDDGTRCWMTALEASAYTGVGATEMVGAFLSNDLTGVQIPGGAKTDCLIARKDIDRWHERRNGEGSRHDH